MSLSVIGFGLGRTGTYSLKLALEQLGFGPCHHMYEVDIRSADQLEGWKAAARGEVDWDEIYAGYNAAVDWPTAAFSRELTEAFPGAKFLLSVRDPENWAVSFSETIARLMASAPPADLGQFREMVGMVIAKTGIPMPASREELRAAFEQHFDNVRATVPEGRLLVFDVREGWEPLCRFLDVPVPDTPFPRTNSTEDFWAGVEQETADSAAAEQAG